MAKRLTITTNRDHAIEVTRVSIKHERLVYVLVADKRIKYPLEQSKVVYIGTTKKGMSRIAQSVAARAEGILRLHGVRKFHARVFTCKPKQNVKSWRKLERAMLLEFREKFGAVPQCNSHGKKMREQDEFKYFSRDRIKSIFAELS